MVSLEAKITLTHSLTHSLNQSIKTHLYNAICRKPIRGAYNELG